VNVAHDAASVGEVEFDDIVLFPEGNEPMAEVQSVRPMGSSKHALKIGAVNIAKGRPEPISIGFT
jgi:hypothetical protein